MRIWGDAMGGQDGIRGYVYQGIVAIIKALNEDGWNYISVEYKTSKDKVDIALLEDDEKVLSAIQVKSSINLFEKKDVVEWLNELISDINAEMYEVYLLGTPKEDANIFVNSINQYYKGVDTQKMKNSLGTYINTLQKHTIKISILPIEQTILMANVRDMLNHYIGEKGYQVNYNVLDALTKLIIGADMLLATSGGCISKVDYDKRIFDWINLSCGNEIKTDNQFSAIDARFYCNGDFFDKIKPIGVSELPSYQELIRECDEKIKVHIDKMLSIDVYAEDETFETNGEKYIPVKDSFAFSNSEEKPYMIDDTIKQGIEFTVANLLNMDLNENLWNFGGLCKKKGLDGKSVLIGTTHQKQKERLFWELLPKIYERIDYYNYAAAFGNICILPIALKNHGSIADQKVVIVLKIPREKVEFIDFNKIVDVLCYDIEITKKLINYDITRKIWSPIENDMVSWEGIGFYSNEVDAKRYFKPDSLALQKEKVLYDLQYYAQYDITFDSTNIIIKWEIDNIRPDEGIMLGKYLVFRKIENNTVINYSIISQNIPRRLDGKLVVLS